MQGTAQVTRHGAADDAGLWDEFRATGSHESRNKLVLLHRPLARSIARRWHARMGSPGWITIDEMESAGLLALIRVVNRFQDREGEAHFARAAAVEIRREICSSINQANGKSRRLRGMSAAEAPKCVSLDEHPELEPCVQCRNSDPADVRRTLRRFLSPKEVKVLLLHFQNGLAYTEIALKLRPPLSSSRVNQIAVRALAKLQQKAAISPDVRDALEGML